MKQIEEEWVDETFVERIIGLGEMFPTPVRNAVSLVAGTTSTVSCAAYKYVYQYFECMFSVLIPLLNEFSIFIS